MKKVSIITFCHRDFGVNYGQNLQAFALSSVITKLGYDVTVISHKNRSEQIKKGYYLRYYTPDLKTIASRNFAKCTEFINNNMKCVQSFNEEDVIDLTADSDILVCGSDAIWRSYHYEPAYYLCISGAEDKLKIAYAPSFVNYVEEDKDIYVNMGRMIEKIDYISIREPIGQNILKNICGIDDATVVLDPTFLMKKDEWLNYAKDVNVSKPYILLYLLDDNNIYDEMIEEIKRKYEVNEVYALHPGIKSIENRNYIDEGVGMDEFLSLVYGAKAVVTNSFHGVAFSIIFQKDMYILKRYHDLLEGDCRFKHITDLCGIEDRLISTKEDILATKDINWKEVNNRLSVERDKSLLYLENALQDYKHKK